MAAITPSLASSPHRVVRFLKFGLVGGSGVLVNLVLLYALVDLLHWSPLVAAVVSIETSTLTNYLLNRAWTWRDRDHSWWSLVSYHGVTLVGAGIQWALLALAVTFLHVHYALASVAGVAVATGWNFLGSDRATFVEYTPERRRRYTRVLLYGLSVVVLGFLASVLAHDWDTFVFQKTVEEFLTRGVTPYETGAAKPDYVYFGVGLPLQPMWYAYPPLPLLLMSVTYAPVAYGAVTAPWAARLLIKLPFLLSNLVLAWLAHRAVLTAEGGDRETRARKALRLEAFLLFNPLFVMVATIWGMFESLLLSFLLLSVLAMRTRKWATAGAWWGAATLVKIFPLYLGPLLLVHIWRRDGFKAAVRYFFAGGLVFGAVSLPFFLLQPGGFLEQTIRMHADRPPGRFSPIAFLYETLLGASRRWPGTLPDDDGLVKVFSLLSFSLTIAILGLIALASLRHKATERSLLWWGGLSLMGGLLATKVVSEQYILLPLGLIALAHWHPESLDVLGPEDRRRRFLVHTTLFVCVAALFDNVHFLLFLPDDVAQRVLGQSVPETILGLATFFRLTAGELRMVLGTAGAFGLLVPFWLSLRLVAPAIADGFGFVRERVLTFVQRHQQRTHLGRVVLAVSLALVMTPAVAVGVFEPKRDVPPQGSGILEGPLVLAHYRTDWFNPTKRPEVPGGAWAESALTPTSGYYNAVAHKIAEDMQILRASGADAVVFTFDPAFEGQSAAGRLVAEEARYPYALEVNLRYLADGNGAVAISPATADRARELLNGPSFNYWRGGYHLRLAPDAGNLVFLAGADRVMPTFTDAERRYVTEFAAATLGPTTRSPDASSPPNLWETAPRNLRELLADDPTAAAWRAAYEEAFRHWWERATDVGGNSTRLDLVVDSAVRLPILPNAPVRVVGSYAPFGADAAGSPAGLMFASVRGDPAHPEAYAQAWSDAIRSRPHGLLVPWNDFDAGLALEPTVQHGAELLHLTERWAPAYRDVGASPMLPAPAWTPTPSAGGV